jgi:hypothetical protein
MEMNYPEVTSLRNRLRDNLTRMLPTWQTLSLFLDPGRLTQWPDSSKNDGSRKDFRIIDNEAGRALRIFTSGMANGATPQVRQWFNLTTTDYKIAKRQNVKKYFEDTSAIITTHLQLSNFYRVMNSAYKDLGIFSNSAFAMLPHPRTGFWLYPFAVGTYSFSCDAEGNPDMFYRDFSMTVRQVVQNYAKLSPTGHIDFSNIPPWVKEQWDAKRYAETMVLTNLIAPNSMYKGGFDKKFYSYTYVQSAGNNLPPQLSNGFRNEQQKGLDASPFIKVTGYSYFPVIIPRWEVRPGDDFGMQGPGEIAMGDILSLQEMEKGRLEGIQKLLKPAMVGHSSLRRHGSSILAGGMTYVDDAGAAAGFKPAFAVDPKIIELINKSQEVKQAINQSYYVDMFQMFNLGEVKTHVSARETDERAAERLSNLQPVLSQIDVDCHSKVLAIAQLLLNDLGRLPPKPEELKGQDTKPEYISALAQAAKLSSMNSLERFNSFVVNTAAGLQDPTLLKKIDGAAFIDEYADVLAIPAKVLTTDEDFNKMRQAVAQQQAQQAAISQQQATAATMKDLSQAELGKGSMLDNLATASQI